jgi:hypothetical protein
MKSYRNIWKDHYGEIPKDHLGRSYDIHHIDGNNQNNDISNLKAVSLEEHWQIHFEQGDYSADNMIADRLGKELYYGWHHKDETKKKISDSNKGKVRSKETTQKILITLKNNGSLKGEKNPMYGKGYKLKGEKNGMFDKKHSDESKEKQRKAKIGIPNPTFSKLMSGENSPNKRPENKKKKKELWLGKNNPRARSIIQYDLYGNYIKEYETIQSAIKELNVKNIRIGDRKRHQKNSLPFIFKYKENI